MIIRLDFNSEEPLYSQLANQIRHGIAKGYLTPGEALPSIRTLSSELAINMHTIAKAYALLKEEGIVDINRSSGVRVSESALAGRGTRYEAVFDKKLADLISESICNGMNKSDFISKVENIFDDIGGN